MKILATQFGVLAVVLAGCAEGASQFQIDETAFSCKGESPDSDGNYYDAYSVPGDHPLGPVATYPWQGVDSAYPNGDENFSAYSPYPAVVGCDFDKVLTDHLNVTDGCLLAVSNSTDGTIGQVQAATSDEAFRMVALGFSDGVPLNIKWTDSGVSYRFFYSAQTGGRNNPGFKAFLRYRTEDNLYVASWRTDGVVQIQRKQCGRYTPLLILPDYGAPSPDQWHQIEFTAIGDQLDLYLDGDHAISITDETFAWGTAGIRIDAMNGARIANWKVFEPPGAPLPPGTTTDAGVPDAPAPVMDAGVGDAAQPDSVFHPPEPL